MELDELPLTRDVDGQLHLASAGPVNLQIGYGDVLGAGGQGAVFRGALFEAETRTLLREVRPSYEYSCTRRCYFSSWRSSRDCQFATRSVP